MRGFIHRIGLAALAALTLAVPASAWASCGFNATQLTYAGDAQTQARCLLRPVKRWAELGEERALPTTLAGLVGRPTDITTQDVATRLATLDVAAGWSLIADDIGKPVSSARNNASGAPRARYFVIHDTSAPNFGAAAFPADLNTRASTNNMGGYMGPGAVAHMFVNRKGQVAVGHDFAVAWRATKQEGALAAAKGLFLHIELLQPRQSLSTAFVGNDAIAPDPGFTGAQYEALARLYIVASVRAGRWMIPGFHAAIDEGRANAHDDPQKFDLAKFDQALGFELVALAGAGPPTPANPATAAAALLTYARQVYAARGLGGRYMEHGCAAPRTDHPRWTGVPVIKCRYRSLGTDATVYMANPSLEKLARWTANACAGLLEPKACVDAVDRRIANQSGGQFPVDGFVIETAEAVGGTGDTPRCILFRDGVTIATASFDVRAPMGGVCGPDSQVDVPAIKAKTYARVASTTREMYRRIDPQAQVGTSASRDLRWLDVVRARHQEALAGDRNRLIDAWVADARAGGELR